MDHRSRHSINATTDSMDFRPRRSIDVSRHSLSPAMGNYCRPLAPSNRPRSGMRLEPLEGSSSHTPLTAMPTSEGVQQEVYDMPRQTISASTTLVPTPPKAGPQPGRTPRRLARGRRHSDVAQVAASPPPQFKIDEPNGASSSAWNRMAELAAPTCSWGSAEPEPQTPRSRQDIRVRRIRRPADFGAGLGLPNGSSSSRVRSCMPTAGTGNIDKARAGDANSAVPEFSAGHVEQAQRCNSLPPTGTSKADGNAAASAKARAVATLQRLFIEEMAKGDTDASGAAARALRRLSEVPQDDRTSDDKPTADTAAKAPILMSAPPEVEVPAERPDTPVDEAAKDVAADHPSSHLSQQVAALAARPAVPRRPEPVCGPRRPRPASRVAVRS